MTGTSGYGPQAVGQGGHIQSHEGTFGYANAGGGMGQGYGTPDTGRNRSGYAEQSHQAGGAYGGDFGRGGGQTQSYGQGGQQGYGQGRQERDYGYPLGQRGNDYPGTQYSGGPQGGQAYDQQSGQGYGGQSRSSGGYQARQQQPQTGQGGDIGFGQGGAFQQGWGGQSDQQRHNMGHGDHANHPGEGGGTYGQGQYGEGARRSEFRDEQRYSGGVHQNQSDRGGFAGVIGGGGRDQSHDHEPDYVHYKSSRLADLDREHHERRTAHERELDDHYNEFREHKRTKFSREFEDWRSQRQSGSQGVEQGSTGGNTGANISTASSGADRDEERSRALSSPGGGTLPTDKTGVGDLNPTAPEGGAGMKGAGAVGGSPTTAAVGSAGAGAPNPSTSADASGVTTGSENKRH